MEGSLACQGAGLVPACQGWGRFRGHVVSCLVRCGLVCCPLRVIPVQLHIVLHRFTTTSPSTWAISGSMSIGSMASARSKSGSTASTSKLMFCKGSSSCLRGGLMNVDMSQNSLI